MAWQAGLFAAGLPCYDSGVAITPGMPESPMPVKVRLYSSLKTFTDGRGTVEVSGSTLGACLQDLARQFPKIKPVLFDERDRLPPRVFVSLNMRSVSSEELDRPVKNGDEIYIVLVVSGG
jgi:MoaD family protein